MVEKGARLERWKGGLPSNMDQKGGKILLLES